MENLTELISCLDQIQTDTDQNLRKQPGFIRKVFMPWQTSTETLFQFKEIYTHRLRTLQQPFDLRNCKTIEDLSNNERVGEIVGMFKRIEAQRVRAFEPEYQDKYENHRPIFSDKDTYELEDQTGKVKLEIKQSTKINSSSKFNPIETPYGVIIKCKGEYNPRINRFVVANVETSMPAPQQKMTVLSGQHKYMGVFCEPTLDQVILIRDFVRNAIDDQTLNLCELVIIGGVNFTNIGEIKRLDEILYELGAMIDTFVVPSSGEENSYLYPQMPLHKSLLKKCYVKKNVANCANPQLFCSRDENSELNTLVSCGQNLRNLKANCNIQDDLELMKLIIEYRHICPCSVFSLPIQSYNYDPLILSETPHLMIHGKCEIFATEFYERENRVGSIQTRLVGLSKGDFVQIDLTSNTLETKKRDINFFKI